jgi:phytoene dehydrogenase-like protein
MFNSIFCEGFARPRAGVRQILDVLVNKYGECGGELRLRSGVHSIQVSGSRIESVTLDNGEVLTADKVLSSAGYVETMSLLPDYDPSKFKNAVGRLSFVEFIMVLDRELAEMGYDTTITFFNNSDRFVYRKPDDLIDVSSGVICCPNNFHFDSPLPEALLRVTNMANFDLWNRLEPEQYKAQKTVWLETTLNEVVKFVPDFRKHIVYTDVFTPKTIYRYTGHLNGAVYGTPNKIKTGATHLENLFLCGTDQGFLGIVGAMLSGISIANLHVLQKG